MKCSRHRCVIDVDLGVEDVRDGERDTVVRADLEEQPLGLLRIGSQNQRRNAVELGEGQRATFVHLVGHIDLFEVDSHLGALAQAWLVGEDFRLLDEQLDERLRSPSSIERAG